MQHIITRWRLSWIWIQGGRGGICLNDWRVAAVIIIQFHPSFRPLNWGIRYANKIAICMEYVWICRQVIKCSCWFIFIVCGWTIYLGVLNIQEQKIWWALFQILRWDGNAQSETDRDNFCITFGVAQGWSGGISWKSVLNGRINKILNDQRNRFLQTTHCLMQAFWN